MFLMPSSSRFPHRALLIASIISRLLEPSDAGGNNSGWDLFPPKCRFHFLRRAFTVQSKRVVGLNQWYAQVSVHVAYMNIMNSMKFTIFCHLTPLTCVLIFRIYKFFFFFFFSENSFVWNNQCTVKLFVFKGCLQELENCILFFF